MIKNLFMGLFLFLMSFVHYANSFQCYYENPNHNVYLWDLQSDELANIVLGVWFLFMEQY